MEQGADKRLEGAYLALLAEHGRIAAAVSRLYTAAGEEAADLEQEIRLQWWRSLAGFAGRSKASTWMYQVALHTALTFLRRRRRRPRPDPLECAGNIADPAPAPGGIEQRRSLALHEALARLEPGERALAYLMLEGCNADEVAEVAGISANAAGVRLHRIRAKLKRMLAGAQEER
jgi:RNA polymerase sigma-70 factor (ECF subfamily)